jgi:hypothetical protein
MCYKESTEDCMLIVSLKDMHSSVCLQIIWLVQVVDEVLCSAFK